MMRRILALLLALLFLPVAALADAFRLDVTVDMEPEAAVSVVRQTGIFAGAQNEAELAAAFVDFLDGFALRMLTQEDAARFEVAFDETTLLDLSLLMGGSDIVLTSDLLGGSGFSMPIEPFSQENSRVLPIMLNTDWAALADDMMSAAMEVLGNAEVVHARGSFVGDAYEGGVYCDTIYLDDKLIAEALDAMMTRRARNVVTYLGVCLGMDGDALLEELSAIHAEAAQVNAHRYILRIVRDGNGGCVGCSLTVMKEEKQLATLSVGFADSSLRIVAGLPMDAVNYWHAHEITWAAENAPDGLTKYNLSGVLTEFTADKSEDYASASAHIADTQLRVQWSAEIGAQGGGLTWKTAVSTRMGDSLVLDKTENQGLYVAGARFANTTTYTRNGKVWMTEKMLGVPCAPLDATADGLTLCSLVEPDEALLTEMALNMGGELAMRLLTVIPIQLLLYFQ